MSIYMTQDIKDFIIEFTQQQANFNKDGKRKEYTEEQAKQLYLDGGLSSYRLIKTVPQIAKFIIELFTAYNDESINEKRMNKLRDDNKEMILKQFKKLSREKESTSLSNAEVKSLVLFNTLRFIFSEILTEYVDNGGNLIREDIEWKPYN